MDEPWYSPAQLQERARASDREQAGGDFGSYAMALRTGAIAGTEVESHNLIFAAARVQQYRCIIPHHAYRSIADIGCGLGFTTIALANAFRDARVVGHEVSPDAVAFAGARFPGATFICQAIDPESDLGDLFDLILFQEFYPFTRTHDWAVQRPYLELGLKHLRPGGVMLIELSERGRDSSILANLAALQPYQPRLRRLAFDRIYRNLKVFWLSSWASAIVGPLRGADRNVAILIRKAA